MYTLRCNFVGKLVIVVIAGWLAACCSIGGQKAALEQHQYLRDTHRHRRMGAKVVDDDNTLSKRQYPSIPDFGCYRSLQGSFETMNDLVEVSKNIPHLSISLIDIGDSWAKSQNMTNANNNNVGFDIYALAMTGTRVPHDADKKKGIMFVMSGLHAREYTPPELVARWAEHMVHGYKEGDADITSILDRTEIHIVLQSNPDARSVAERNREIKRRKNVNNRYGNATMVSCPSNETGVDLNRNFPLFWGRDSADSSNDPCAEDYRGTGPASEPEVRAIVEYAKSIFPTAQRQHAAEKIHNNNNASPNEMAKGIFLDIHSAGNMVVWPWTFAEQKSANDDGLRSIATKIHQFNDYDLSGPGMNAVSPISGCSTDFAYGALGAAAVAIELGTEWYEKCDYFLGNILPKNLPVLTYAARISRVPFWLSKGPDIGKTKLIQRMSDAIVEVEALAFDPSLVVVEIQVFIDSHPDDDDDKSETLIIAEQSLVQSNNTNITVGRTKLPFLPPGRHILHIRAKASNNHFGPVKAMWYDAPTAIDNNRVAEAKEESLDCVDGQGLFPVSSGILVHCDWLAVRPKDRSRFCVSGYPAYSICQQTCGNCKKSHI